MDQLQKESSAINASWLAREDGLYLESGSEIIAVFAAEVVRAEFKEVAEFRGYVLEAKPSVALSGLSFSRYPAKIQLALEMPVEGNLKPRLEIQAVFQQTSYVLRDLPSRDQILVGNKWFPVIPDEIDEARTLLDKCGINKPSCVSLKNCLDLIRSGSSMIHVSYTAPDPEKSEELSSEISRTLSDRLQAAGFLGKLYPYQEAGLSWLHSIAEEGLGCILADEMGLGKTLQIISLLTILVRKWSKPALIIAPATLLENWRREFTKFSPDIKVLVHAGPLRTGFPSRLKQHQVIVTSYDTAVRDQGMLSMFHWSFVILDEAQAIKNPETKRAAAAKIFQRNSGIAVSGTPFENRLRDIWSLMDFSCPGFLGTLGQFETEHPDSEESASRVERMISPLVLRRLVRDVAKDLPEKIIISQPVCMTDYELENYEKVRQEIVTEYGKSGVFVALGKLRQFCSHPFILEENHTDDDPATVSGKYERLLEILSEIRSSGQKAIIYTSFCRMIDILASDLKVRFAVPIFQIDGRTPVPDRQMVVDSFSSVGGTAFLVLNPRAAGTGLNITAANHVIHYTLEWNPAIEDQATARAFRKGQELPVTVHRLFYPDTVEEVVDDRIERKRRLAEIAIVGTEAAAAEAADIARALALSPGTRRKD